MSVFFDSILGKLRRDDLKAAISYVNGLGIYATTSVANYSALPNPTTVSGRTYVALSSQGTQWLPGSLGGTYYPAGYYYSNGTSWFYSTTAYQATQAEVNAGTNTDKFLTPATFNNATKLLLTLQQVLTNGNTTGGLAIRSDNGLVSLHVVNTEGLLYYSGINEGIVSVTNNNANLYHTTLTEVLSDNLINLIAPSVKKNGVEVATINDINDLLNGLSWKKSVLYSTTTGENLTLSGLTATIDGAVRTLLVTDRILVKNQTLATANGLYNPSATAWVRVLDADISSELLAATVYVREGNLEKNRVYTVNVSPITLGTTNITFALIAGLGNYINGTYLKLTGNVFDIDFTTFTTAQITDALNKRYVTDANLVVIGNTSGTNTGDNATNTQYSGLATSKENAITGTTSADFWSGAKTFINFATTVRSTVLTGLSLATSQVIVATDSVILALGYLQSQISGKRNFSRTTFGDANYTVLVTDDYLATTATFTASRTVTLDGTRITNKDLVISDDFGTISSTTNLIITVQTGKKLNGVLNGTEQMTIPFGQRRLFPDGSGNWNFDSAILRGFLPTTVGLIPISTGALNTIGQNSSIKFDTVSNNLLLGNPTPSVWTFLKGGIDGGSNAFILGNSGDMHFCSNAYGLGTWKYYGAGKALNAYYYNGSFVVRTAPTGSTGGLITWTDRFTVTDVSVTLGAKLILPTATTSSSSINLANGVTPTTPIQGDVWGVSNRLLHNTNSVSETIAYLSDVNKYTALGTVAPGALTYLTNRTVNVTPNATGTFTTTVPSAGTECFLIIVTSGVISYTLTFGTGFITTGVLTTGAITAKTYTLSFISDGTNLIELSRTIAM